MYYNMKWVNPNVDIIFLVVVLLIVLCIYCDSKDDNKKI